MKILFITLLLFFIQPPVYSQVQMEWVKRYNGNANSFDIVETMQLDAESNVYVAGNSYNLNTQQDITVIKYNTKGGQVWARSFDSGLNSVDLVNAASLSGNKFLFLTGTFTNSFSNSQALTIKIDSNGKIEWTNFFADSSYISTSGIDIKNDDDGNSIVLASGRKASGNNEIILFKLNSAGDLEWTKIYNEDNLDYIPAGIAMDGESNCYVTSSVRIQSGITNIITLKYSPAGDLIWERIFNTGNDDRPVKIISSSDNEIALTGVSYSAGSHFDIVTLNYNAAGDLIWSRIFNGSGNHLDYSYDIASDQAGNIYITGSSRSDSTLGSEDMIILKYDSGGNLIVSSSYNGKSGGSDIGFSIAVDDDNNIYIGGSTDRGNFQMMFATLMFSPAGIFRWIQTYYDSNTPEDFIYKVALNKEREVFVTGISFNSESDYDFTTIKYSRSVGINPLSGSIPSEFRLYQNYPNPFNPSTNIRFDIRNAGFVTLKVFDITGKEIAVLINENLQAGEYNYQLSINNYELGSGIYFYTLTAGEFYTTRKMLLIK